MFWIAAVALGGGYAGIGILSANQVTDAHIVAYR
jgi:hypothetical protein